MGATFGTHYSHLQLGAALQPFPEQPAEAVLCDVIDTPDRPPDGAFDRVVRCFTCNDPLMSYLPFSFLIVLCSLNTRGPRAILSSDSYSLDHSPVVIELLFGTLSVPVASLSLRSTATRGTTTGARGGRGAGSATG
ncbi:hypothetical protein HETIRDRAFT_316913 [Heterobasidion irregulare TC 32-1]|uniref:Uncharacterized protein n=1 Tax=Heterobasidion irregulare (strain TC 32-1) TaxID=747525 RepID=W4KAG2_HETIT|nr:uncharacterized protein HETIRDRAFT_316913 [Heterobasidion irregulare TC 32-1]ETW82076.1 hypothetical protein HETIRDRAFT_316913 [Heterobasidion irregulare TC 32-1]